MIGQYLYTLIIGHKSCNILSILCKLTLQKKLQNVVTNSVFWTKGKTTKTRKQIIKYKKTLPKREIDPGTSLTQSGCVTSAPPSQLDYRL